MSAVQAKFLKDLKTEKSISEQILEGSIAVNSVEAFKGLLKQFPGDPGLFRAYSDLLARKNLRDLAATSYETTAKLYTDAGLILQAAVAKMLEWQIKSPSPKEVRLFFRRLQKIKLSDSPLKDLFDKLSAPELIATISRMKRVRVPAGHIVKTVGDEESDLFLVISGTLKDSIYQSLGKKEKSHRKAILHLTENDFFGDIYPFKENIRSQSHTEAMTQVELARISKKQLRNLCAKYPNIELGLIHLYKIRSESGEEIFPRMIRKTERHWMPIKLNLLVYTNGSLDHPIILEGYCWDISIGGVCIVLDSKEGITSNLVYFHKAIKNARIKLSLPCEGLELKVPGSIVWSREVYLDGEKDLVLGIKFDEMSPKMHGMLFAFAENLSNMK